MASMPIFPAATRSESSAGTVAARALFARSFSDWRISTTGEVVRNRELRVGYLEQHNAFEPGRGGGGVLGALHRVARRGSVAKLRDDCSSKGALLETAVDQLPGGYQTRVKLVSMLLRDPNYLVLDEPTNFLDLRTLLLLERFLASFRGGFLVVSHDREFLKRTCDKTIEVERGQVRTFNGGIEDYLVFKDELREQEERYNRNIEAKRKHLQEFVDRYRVRAATASRAQSKLKQMDRLQRIEVGVAGSTARIRIPPVEERKGVALRVEDLSIGYPESVVADGIHFEIERGQHVAVLGDNGQGKTTFLRTIAGDLAARSGAFTWGHGIETSYYAQHVYSALPPNLDVVTHLESVAANDVTRQDVLDVAGSFLFRGDDVEKPISVLSGGERARVCLAGLLLSRRPVLLLDEPTNHLDFETVEALGRALREYKGTLFFVSHDRTFVQLAATNILEVRDGAVTLYPADYETYVYRAERELEERQDEKSPVQEAKRSGREATSHQQRREQRSRLNRLKSAARRQEKRFEDLGEEKEKLQNYFLENPMERSAEKEQRLRQVDEELASVEEEWLGMLSDIEALEAERND